MVKAEDIKTIAPELHSETIETIQFFLTMALLRCDATVWGLYRDMGVTFLTAHLLTLKKRRGTAGQVIEQKVGNLEIQYADMASGKKLDLSFMQTVYGIEYLQLRNLIVITPIVV